MSNVATMRIARTPRALVASVLALALALSYAPAVAAVRDLVSVIVIGRDTGSAAQLTEGFGGEVDRPLPIVNGVSARVPASRVDDLSRVAYVVTDRSIRMQSASYGAGLASAYPHEVGATSLWSRGATGAGVAVALVDTGVAEVPDLAGRVVASANLSSEDDAADTFGHGTFQAGLIAGNGASSDGRYVGVAPDAELVSIKVAGRDGSTSLGQVLAGVQLVDVAADLFDVRVALLAIDSESPLPPDLDPLSWALRVLWSHDVVVVVPAGNDGPEAETIASPGEDPLLLTAGSVDDHGTPEVDDDLVSEFSSRGPTRWGADKPDVAAPGEHLVSLRAPGSTVDEQNPSARVEDAYFKGSGTSMSAAVTAGAAALLLSERPDLSADHVKALLMGTAAGIADGDVSSTGAGVVDAAAAVDFDGELPEFPDAPDLADGSFFDHGKGRVHRRGSARSWESRQWASRQWASRQWASRSWAARQWASRQWSWDEWGDFASRTWASRSWAARQWAMDAWFSRSWASRTWASRTWASRQWSDERWAARQWASRTWASRSWASRSWASRTWNADEWASRQWSSRTWSMDEWLSRSWSSRTWSNEQWDSRSWSSRTWSSRTWSGETWDSRTWSSRTWSSRTWSGASWG